MVADAGELEPRSGAEFDYDRTVALSDGLFAIALTLLVLTITLPNLSGAAEHLLAHRLRQQLPDQLFSYALSFAVLGLLWVRHHTMFRSIDRINATLIVLNLAYLALVAFLPFPTSLVGRYASQPVSVVIYAVTIVLITAVALISRVYVDRAGLMAPGASREPLQRYFIVSGVFLASIPVALLVDASAARWMWIALLVTGPLPWLRSRAKPDQPSN